MKHRYFIDILLLLALTVKVGAQPLATAADTAFAQHPADTAFAQHPADTAFVLHPADSVSTDTVVYCLSLPEFVVRGHYRGMLDKMLPKPSATERQLLQSVPQGFNPLGLVAWGFDKIWGNRIRHREEVRRQKRKMIIDNY